MPKRQQRLRRDALSCQSCRLGKLRCDRSRPSCSNCQRRATACEYTLQSEESAAQQCLELPAAISDSGGSSASLAKASLQDLHYLRAENRVIQTENRALAARLERLEQTFTQSQATPAAALNTEEKDGVVFNKGVGPPTPQTQSAAGQASEDYQWLEKMGASEEEMIGPFEIEICSLEQTLSIDPAAPPLRSVRMPSHEVAIACLDAHAQYLDAVQHIMHIEDVRLMIDRIYSQIELLPSSVKVHAGAIAFILSLCATVAFHSTLGFSGVLLFTDTPSSLRASSVWIMQALSSMEQARLASSATLEAIQASVLLCFLLYQLEGHTYRVRMMHATSVIMARDLGLHKTDADNVVLEGQTQADVIQTEVKRRLWWYIASTDWHLSMIGGPQEGLYLIHPRHMNVKLPRNITPDDLTNESSDFERSAAEPTPMSFYLERVKLSVLCREASDMLYHHSDPNSVDYDMIRLLDTRFEKQLQELPRFLRFDLPVSLLRAEYGTAYNEQTSIQSLAIYVIVYTRRCKLHLPYLVRAKSDAKFAFSRWMGLHAARSIFGIRQTVLTESGSAAAVYLKRGGMLQHFFFATLVLVIDLCANRGESGKDRDGIAEVGEALRIIEEMKQSAPLGTQLLDSLMAILSKHKVSFPDIHQKDRMFIPSVPLGSDQVNSCIITGNATAAINPSQLAAGTDKGDASSCDDGWQSFLDQGTMLDLQDWDQLLSDLDMRMG